jgi:small subunit ribosomal protein S1
VLKYNPETERVSLGLKQITEDPWTTVHEHFPIGSRVRGKVTSLRDYGAFVELETGVEGLIHVSEMSWTRRVKHPSKMVAVGDEVEAVVLDVDPKNQRISLGMKQLEANPFESLADRYPPGTLVKGTVRNIADFGLFIEIEDGIDGMCHISDLSWTYRARHPSEIYQKGDQVEAVVLRVEREGDKPRISLGIKQAIDDPWGRIPSDYPPGSTHSVRVLRLTEQGALVELEKGVEGVIHTSDLSDEHVEDPGKLVAPGDVVRAEIISIDPMERRIGLSLKAGTVREEAPAPVGAAARASRSTLGDVFKDKLAGLQVKKE